MERYGLTRSMSAKGCSPDNAAAEGFFGRMKTESVYPEHWEKRTRDEVLVLIDEYIHWYNHERIKQSLGWMSPVQYVKAKEWLHDYLQENVRSPDGPTALTQRPPHSQTAPETVPYSNLPTHSQPYSSISIQFFQRVEESSR